MTTPTSPLLQPGVDSLEGEHAPSPAARSGTKSRSGAGRSQRKPRAMLGLVHLSAIVVTGLGLTLGVFLARSHQTERTQTIYQLSGTSLQQTQDQARRGVPEAQYQLGRNYWNRLDYEKGLTWLRAAASQQHAEAEYALGQHYLSGNGVPQHYETALHYFALAAEHGHQAAQHRLGMIYLEGAIVPTDQISAYIWLNIAAARGHEEAKAARDTLARAMSREALAQAQNSSAQQLARMGTTTVALNTLK